MHFLDDLIWLCVLESEVRDTLLTHAPNEPVFPFRRFAGLSASTKKGGERSVGLPSRSRNPKTIPQIILALNRTKTEQRDEPEGAAQTAARKIASEQ